MNKYDKLLARERKEIFIPKQYQIPPPDDDIDQKTEWYINEERCEFYHEWFQYIEEYD